jgi:hypothetical protein
MVTVFGRTFLVRIDPSPAIRYGVRASSGVFDAVKNPRRIELNVVLPIRYQARISHQLSGWVTGYVYYCIRAERAAVHSTYARWSPVGNVSAFQVSRSGCGRIKRWEVWRRRAIKQYRSLTYSASWIVGKVDDVKINSKQFKQVWPTLSGYWIKRIPNVVKIISKCVVSVRV